MKRRLWTTSLALVLGMAAAVNLKAQDTAQSAKASQATLDVPVTDFDFGYAPQGSSISQRFWLKNVGGDTLRITDVRPGCGCTKAPLTKKELAAGDSTYVEVIFSTGSYSSRVTKSATIISNTHGASPPLTFTAWPSNRMDSLPPFRFLPPRLILDDNRSTSESNEWIYNVTATNISSQPCVLKVISAPDELIDIVVPKEELKPGAEEMIEVRLHPDASDTTFAKSFTVEASDSARTRYTIPVTKVMRWGPAPSPSR